MPVLRKDGPYIWSTWLSKLLVGDNSRLWASWFKAQFDSKSGGKAEQVNNPTCWQIGHTDMLNRKAQQLREQGYEVTRENRNHFTVNVKCLNVTIAGQCDRTARQGDLPWIIDVMSERTRLAEQALVMLYLYLFPLAKPELQGLTVKGLLVYGDHEEVIKPEEVGRQFKQVFEGLVGRLANTREPAGKVPTWSECQCCDISRTHCPERVEQPDGAVATTDRF